MPQTKKAAQWQQDQCPSTIVTLQQRFAQSSIKLIRLRGYSSSNSARDYQKGKAPLDNGWNQTSRSGLTQSEVDSWLDEGGWIGLVIPKGYILVDVDDKQEGVLLRGILESLGLSYHVIETPNGYQFFFRDNGLVRSQIVKSITEVCFCVDYRLAEKGYIVLPAVNTEGRIWAGVADHELSDMPEWLASIGSGKKGRPFQLPIEEGERNTTLHSHGSRLKGKGKSDAETQELLQFMNRFLVSPPLDENEITNMMASIKSYERGNSSKQWKQDERPNIVELAESILAEIPCFTYRGQLFAYKNGVYSPDGEPLIRKAAQERLGKHSRSQMLREVETWIKTETYMEHEQYLQQVNMHHDRINVRNGLLDYRTGILYSHDSGVYSTIQLPVEYNPNASCSKIERFFQQLVPQDTYPLLEEMVGYSLASHTNYQKAFLLLGKGSNGKSTFLDLLQKLVGSTNVSHVSLHDLSDDRFAVAQVANKLINACDDLGGRGIRATDRFKTLIGGGVIDGEFKGENRFAFRSMATMFFSTNELPDVNDTSDGYWRRWIVIPFTLKLTEAQRVEGFIHQLTSPPEMSGLLNLAIRGLNRLEHQRGFTQNESTATALRRYKETSNHVLLFVEEKCKLGDGKVRKEDLLNQYRQWCIDSGYVAVGKIKLYRIIEELEGVYSCKSDGVHMFGGIQLSTT